MDKSASFVGAATPRRSTSSLGDCESRRDDKYSYVFGTSRAKSGSHIFLAQIRDSRSVSQTSDWGMNERLKAQIEEQGYGLSLTKIHHGAATFD